MPPAFLNHRVPTACGTPTPTAASSLAVPAAIAAQNRRRSSGPATGGRPGENKRTRPERSERRFRMFIATPVKVLRRPLESAQYASEQFQQLMADNGVACSMSRSGNVWDNAAMESFFSSLKTERIGKKVYRSRDAARADVFDYIERFYNPVRRHSTIGYLSPLEFERKVGLA
jgi:putative transposase